MGGKLGTIFAKAGHDVVFSYARSQRKLNRLAHQAGRRAVAGTPREAAEDADVLLLAVHWSRVNDVLTQAGNISGKVLITAHVIWCRGVGEEDETGHAAVVRACSIVATTTMRRTSWRS